MYIFRQFRLMSGVLAKILSKDIYCLITFFSPVLFIFVLCFLLGNSPASEFYICRRFGTLSVPSS